MKIDLHVHSSDRSPCGQASDEEQVRAAIVAGLDAIVFTDHHCFVPLEQLDALNRQFAPFRVFSGIEMTCQGEDFLVIGVRDPSLERAGWEYADLYTFVRQRGGFLALAHPFRYRQEIAVDCDRLRPDAIEICSANTPPKARSRIRKLAQKWRAHLLSNSDAHATERLGTYYIVLDERIADEAALVALLKAGQFQCHSRCPAG
ncbi:MAG: PHP-associated domain-containing protein [Chloroflexota bacterium]